MAKNTGQGLRSGTRVTRRRTSPLTGLWTVRNSSSGAFMRAGAGSVMDIGGHSTARALGARIPRRDEGLIRMPRGAVLLVLGLIVGVLVAVLPLPGVLPTIGYVAALIMVIAGIIMLVLDLTGGVRDPRA